MILTGQNVEDLQQSCAELNHRAEVLLRLMQPSPGPGWPRTFPLIIVFFLQFSPHSIRMAAFRLTHWRAPIPREYATFSCVRSL
jgi:hypothetical protein